VEPKSRFFKFGIIFAKTRLFYRSLKKERKVRAAKGTAPREKRGQRKGDDAPTDSVAEI
jgi:hypothetical protein